MNEQPDYLFADELASQAQRYAEPGLADFLVWLVPLTVLFAALAYAILVARRTIKMQKAALEQYRDVAARQERSLVLAEESVKQQAEMVRLLRRLAEPNG